jgi:plasmid stabilization system protein ParE
LDGTSKKRSSRNLQFFPSGFPRLCAVALVDKLYWSTERLNDFPLSGRNIPELRLPHLREIIAENYRILYEIQEQTVNILAVIHSRQHLRKALKKRISRR